MTPPTRAGFTLAEMLVATAILLLIAGGLLLIAVPSQRGFRSQPAMLDVQQRLRAGTEVIRAPLQSAGSGTLPAPAVPLGSLVPCVLPYRIGLRRADSAGVFQPDVITTISMVPGSAAAPIDSSFRGESGTVGLVPVPGCPIGRPACGIEVGMSVLLLEPSGQWDLYGVSAVLVDRVTLQARGPSSGRPYRAGAWLVPVETCTHYLRAGAGPDGPQLMQYDGNQSDLPQLDHIVSLSFEYFGEPRPPRPRAPPGPAGQLMIYGPVPPAVDEDDERDSWGPGENCVVTTSGGQQVARLADAGGTTLSPLGREALTDGPWCPDAAASTRFDADLFRIRKVRVTLRVEAWVDLMRGSDRRFFRRPGSSGGRPDVVPDQEVSFDVVPRTIGAGR